MPLKFHANRGITKIMSRFIIECLWGLFTLEKSLSFQNGERANKFCSLIWWEKRQVNRTPGFCLEKLEKWVCHLTDRRVFKEEPWGWAGWGGGGKGKSGAHIEFQMDIRYPRRNVKWAAGHTDLESRKYSLVDE